MTKRHQQPLEELLHDGAPHPEIIIEGLRIFQRFIKMTNHLPHQAFVLTGKAYFVHVAKAAVIKVGRADHKGLSVGKE